MKITDERKMKKKNKQRQKKTRLTEDTVKG